MDENADLMTHITHMTTLSERLREAGEEVSDKKFATAVLGSLPESYNTFIMSLNARDASQLSWDAVKPLLIEEYMKRKEKRAKDEKSKDEALYTFHKASFTPRANNSGNVASSHYGNRASGMNPNFNTRGGGGGRRIQHGGRRGGNAYKQCWSCQGFGHVSRNCPLIKKNLAFA